MRLRSWLPGVIFTAIAAMAAAGPKNLSSADGTSCCARIASEGSDVFVVWQDDTEGFLNKEIFVAHSSNGGKKYRKKLNLSDNATDDSANPSVAIEGSNVYVVWTYLGSNTGDIFFTRSTDLGDTWSVPVNLSDDVNPCFYPEVRVDAGVVYVSWEESTATATEVMFRRSPDGGVSFEPEVNLSSSLGRSGFPKLETQGGNVFVLWEDESDGDADLFLRRSLDQGQTFEPVVDLSNDVGNSVHSALAVDGSVVVVAWTDFGAQLGEIQLRRSGDSGASFGAPLNLSNTVDSVSQWPQLDVEGSDVHVVWEDDAALKVDVYYARSQDGGVSFEPERNLSEGQIGTSARPLVVALDPALLVSWIDDTAGDFDVLVARSKDGGDKFTKPKNLSRKGKFGPAERQAVVIAPHKKPGKAGRGVIAFEWQTRDPANREIFATRK